MSYNVISLEDMYNAIGEEQLKALLKNFKCNLNKDVEYFIKEKAIQFLKLGISKTFLVSTSYKGNNVIVGYFSLTNKVTRIKKNILSNSLKKKLNRFSQNDDPKYYIVSLPLIGQLGKNYYDDYNTLISGDVLLKLACDKVKEAQQILGGKFVFLECEDKEILKNFYESNGFVCFGKRNLEKDEREQNSGEYLLQMLCYLSSNIKSNE
jgi:hypothetical protein